MVCHWPASFLYFVALRFLKLSLSPSAVVPFALSEFTTSQEETRKNVFRGERGTLPPPFWPYYFQPTRKEGGGFEPPPNIWSCRGNLSPRRCKTPQNAAKSCKTPQTPQTPQNTAKRCKTPQNAATHWKAPHTGKHCKTLQMIAKSLHRKKYTGKRRKTRENAGKCRKMPQILQYGDKSLRDQIFGGAKKTHPLFRSVEINLGPKLGGHSPLPPLKIFFLVSSRAQLQSTAFLAKKNINLFCRNITRVKILP